MEIVDLRGERSSGEKGVKAQFAEAGQEGTGNVASRAKEESIDKEICKIDANGTDYESNWIDVANRPDAGNITISSQKLFTSCSDSIHYQTEYKQEM
jgi:hypothetical protein